jgi:DNA-binding HxlR family transcriptional regulator
MVLQIKSIASMTDAEIEAYSEEKAREGYLCPMVAFDQIAGGKYKLRTLWVLRNGPRRYGEIRRSLVTGSQGRPVTPRILSRELKDLASRGLVERTEYPGVPPRVDYRLTELGRTLLPIIDAVIAWGFTGSHVRILPEARPPSARAAA